MEIGDFIYLINKYFCLDITKENTDSLKKKISIEILSLLAHIGYCLRDGFLYFE